MQINNSITKPKSPAFGSNAGIAKEILTGKASKIAKSIEFNSMNMSFPVLLTVMFAGVLAPRLKQAQDKFDREEILRRDAISISTIAFGAPILSKLFSKACEKSSGFALTIKPEPKNTAQKVLNYLRPVGGVHVLTSEQIVSKYSEIEKYNGGAAGFCEFVDQQRGDLKKVFGIKEETKNLVESLCGGKEAFEKADNKKIISSIKTAMEKTPEKISELYTHFAKSDNAFVQKAKSMNSKFGFISMVCLVPLFLGVILPKVNEKITKQKIKNAKLPEADTKTSEHHQLYQNPYFMASEQKDKTIFNRFFKSN